MDCTVTGRYQSSKDLLQGGLDFPCLIQFTINDEEICKNLEKLIQISLAETGVQHPDLYALPVGNTASQPKSPPASPPAIMVKKEPELYDDIQGFALEDTGENSETTIN